MKNVVATVDNRPKNSEIQLKTEKWKFWLSLLILPFGLFRIWRVKGWFIVKLIYSLFAALISLITTMYLGTLLFAAFLPALDRTVGNRADRTIYNTAGNYSATFVKTGNETNGEYELVQVELEPYGGNDWHYHASFKEEFTAIDGPVRIGHNGEELIIQPGESTAANTKDMHFFKNARNERTLLSVKIVPAAGLEKTLRVAYGLINDGKLKDDMTENPWHMALLLGYSESYLEGLPGWFQEPLINSLAKIAQWRGEDKELYKYFK